MSQILDHPGLRPGETAWEGFTKREVLVQSACPDCDKGMLYVPARFCARCQGDGFLIVRREERTP